MSASEEAIIWVRLQGSREVLAASGAMRASMAELGVTVDETGAAMGRTAHRGYLMNQALFTVRRVLYGATLATLGLGAAALRMGYNYNSAMQTAKVALAPVFSSTQGLNKELQYLFNFTKFTPFQFKDVTTAFRQMYFGMRALHIPVQTVNLLLHAMTDALAAVGKDSPGQLNRVSTALQHMAYLGHVTGQIVTQLNRDGLPFTAALKTQLGLTSDQIHNIGALNISSARAIDALRKYIESSASGVQGAAYRIATQSVHGLFTTFKDNISQLFGYIEQKPFLGAQNFLERMNAALGNTANLLQSGKIHGVQGVVDSLFGNNAGLVWQQVSADIHLLWTNVVQLVGAFITSKPLWVTIYAGLVALHAALLIVTPLLQRFGSALYILIPLFIAYKTVVYAAALSEARLVFWTAVTTSETKKLTFVQFLACLGTRAYAAAVAFLALENKALWFAEMRLAAATILVALRMRVAMVATRLYMISMGLLALVVGDGVVAAFSAAATAAWAFTAALLADPLTWLVIGIVALVAGLVVLYYKWNFFHNAVDSTWHLIRDNARYIAIALSFAFAPLLTAVAAITTIAHYWNTIKGAWNSLFGGGGGGGNNAMIPTGPTSIFAGIPGARNPLGPGGFQHFTNSSSSLGSSFAGSTITPLSQHKITPIIGPGSTTVQDDRPLVVHVMVDKKVLGTVTAEEIAKARASR